MQSLFLVARRQKDRIKIFGHGVAKMGEISRRNTLETIGIMFQSEIPSPGQELGNVTHFIAYQRAIPGSGRMTIKNTELKFSVCQMGQISKFLLWRENFAPEHEASGLESIPPANFIHFGCTEAENLDSVFLTVVRP